MVRNIKAIYENGVLRPLSPLQGVRDREVVDVAVSSMSATRIQGIPTSHPMAGVIGILPDEDAREMLHIIEEEFGNVSPDDWK